MARRAPSNRPERTGWHPGSLRRRLSALIVLVLALATGVANAAVAGPKPQDGYFWHPELASSGPMVIVISLDEQRIYVYRNGLAVGASRISSGRAGYETPTGVYTILQKAREHRSNLYDDAPMPYMQRLTWDGVALHAGVLPGRPASHGCVRLPLPFAERLFAASERGTVVVVADGRVAPATVNHPAAIAPIDLSGSPIDFAAPPVADLSALPAGNDPLSIVVSTYDRSLYVIQGGRLLATSALDVPPGFTVGGTLLYVRRAARPGEATDDPSRPLWSAYRVLGQGPVPEPAQLAGRLKVPEAFGAQLRRLLAVGTTVLVTDLPGRGGTATPYGTLLEAESHAGMPGSP